ncbi:MAG: hypothetical protein ACP5HK_02020 [Acidilobus sp.]
MAWRVCAEKTVSVAMRVPSMGYGLHGHDVTVRACLCYRAKEGHVDVEALARSLLDLLTPVDHRALWEVVGGEGALEDLVSYVLAGLSPRPCYVSASVPGRYVEYVEGPNA